MPGVETDLQLRKRMKHGRSEALRRHGYGACYVVGPKADGPVKVGYATDLVTRVSALQSGSWLKLYIFECMWFVGPLVAGRVEAGALLKLRTEGLQLRGEWFNTTATKAADALRESARDLGFKWFDEEERRVRGEQMFNSYQRRLIGMFAK